MWYESKSQEKRSRSHNLSCWLMFCDICTLLEWQQALSVKILASFKIELPHMQGEISPSICCWIANTRYKISKEQCIVLIVKIAFQRELHITLAFSLCPTHAYIYFALTHTQTNVAKQMQCVSAWMSYKQTHTRARLVIASLLYICWYLYLSVDK